MKVSVEKGRKWVSVTNPGTPGDLCEYWTTKYKNKENDDIRKNKNSNCEAKNVLTESSSAKHKNNTKNSKKRGQSRGKQEERNERKQRSTNRARERRNNNKYQGTRR
jgi:hypothetical protein